MTGKIIRPAPAEIEYRNMGRNMRFLITDQPQVLSNVSVCPLSDIDLLEDYQWIILLFLMHCLRKISREILSPQLSSPSETRFYGPQKALPRVATKLDEK